MKFLIDSFPAAVFFLAYALFDIYMATGAVMVACCVQTFGFRLMNGSFEKMHLATLALALVFGGATLALRDPEFIKAKPTLIYAMFALTFLGSHFVGEKLMVERMMGQTLELSKGLWTRLNLIWVAFFSILAYANVFVAGNFSEATWVNFKTFGDIVLTVVFVIAQIVFLRNYLVEPDAENEVGAAEKPE